MNLAKTTFHALAIVIALAVLHAPEVRAAQADYERTPVLMVHGYFVINDAGSATWAGMKKRLVEDGWPEEYIATPSFDDVRGCDPEHALEIQAWVEDLVAKTGFDKVDIVAHSEGCLNTMHYLKNLCGVGRVRRFVALAGAFHGTVVACVDPFSCGAAEMCIGSGPDGWKENEGLVAINACDETPGDVLYTSVWSTFDEIITPASGSILAGANNIEVETDWVEHAGIFLCDECYDHVRSALLDGTGGNEDGPGWACIPHCVPPAPDPAPESDSVGDSQPTPELAPDLAPEAAPDSAPEPVPERIPDAADVIEADSAELPGPDVPTVPAAVPSVGGCTTGTSGDGSLPAVGLFLFLILGLVLCRGRGLFRSPRNLPCPSPCPSAPLCGSAALRETCPAPQGHRIKIPSQ